MISVSVGIGKNSEARLAGIEAAESALSSLQDKRADCALVFASSSLNSNDVIKAISEKVEGVPIVGCTSAYEITSEGLVSSGSVVLVLLSSDQIKFSTGFGLNIDKDSKKSSSDCVSTIDPSVRDLIIFLDSLTFDFSSFISGMSKLSNSNPSLIISGASDDLKFIDTNQFFNNSVYGNSAICLGMSGLYDSAIVTTHSFLPVGVLKKITKATNDIIYEIDGQRAVELYKDYFGDEYDDMVKQDSLMDFASFYPLGIYEENSVKPILRIPTRIDLSKGSIHTGGFIPANSGVRLQISDKRQNKKVARDAAISLLEKLGGKKPKFVMIISSIARRRIEGEMNGEEIREIQNILGIDVPVFGFYSFAEYVEEKGKKNIPYISNGSLTLFAVAE